MYSFEVIRSLIYIVGLRGHKFVIFSCTVMRIQSSVSYTVEVISSYVRPASCAKQASFYAEEP